jgi:tetratricopeptide (TPR) repeat protein
MPSMPAALLLVVLSGIFAWWAWKEGGYFDTVFLPGSMVLCAVAVLLLVVLPRQELRLSPAAGVGLGALIGLGLWTLASALWSPAPEAALSDAQRVLVYGLLFGLGLWLGHLLRARPGLALLPFGIATAVAGIATVVALLTSSTPSDVLEVDATLDFPIGYRNANAAFFAIAVFPALGLATDFDLDWRVRGLALGVATLAIDLLMLSQSRASIPAVAVALAALLILSPHRLRTLCWLALAVLPALLVIPALSDLYTAGNEPRGFEQIGPEMRAAGRATALSAVAAVVAGSALARFGNRIPGLSSPGGRSDRIVLAGLGCLAAAAAIGFVIKTGNPVDWIGDRVDEFKEGESDFSGQASRFTFNAGSNRYDLWRVAVDDARADPLLGDGAGGFEYSYLRQKEAPKQNARDAHSVELEVLSELGIPGLLLLCAALGAIGAAAMIARRAGPEAANVCAVALAGGAYWLVHTSVDWFWTYPAITAPVFALLGVACAPAAWRPGAGSRFPWRIAAAAGVVIFALAAIPPFLSARYVDHAYAVWRTDLERAYDDIDRARALNPLSDVPLLAEGAIARAAGDRERAIAAFEDVTEERPEEWAAHYLLADMQQESDPAVARREIATALELNPLSDRVRTLARRLGVGVPPLPS